MGTIEELNQIERMIDDKIYDYYKRKGKEPKHIVMPKHVLSALQAKYEFFTGDHAELLRMEMAMGKKLGTVDTFRGIKVTALDVDELTILVG